MNLDRSVDCLDKGVPFGFQPGEKANVLAGDLHFPLMVLKDTALDWNIKAMADWCSGEGFLLAPHGKTTMCPKLWDRQLAAGAWGITVAHASQAMVAVRASVRRILIANQVVGKAAVRSIAAALNADSKLEIYTLVDSVESVRELAGQLETAGAQRPVQVLIEWGKPHWRTGARSQSQALEVHREVLRHQASVRFAGVECFEGLAHSDVSTEEIAQVDEILDATVALAARLEAESERRLIVSVGGSAFLDRVADRCRGARDRFTILLRSGCYATHDHGYYGRRAVAAEQRNSSLPHFEPALELWSIVQSKRDEDRAVLTFGKRDCPYDIELPLPLFALQSDGSRLALESTRITHLNDQHAFLGDPPAGLAVGDLVCCGISHPCTAFDKWRAIPLVDDSYNVIDWYGTYF